MFYLQGGSKGSRHKKPVASALFQLLFSYLNISYVIHDYLEKVHDTTISEVCNSLLLLDLRLSLTSTYFFPMNRHCHFPLVQLLFTHMPQL